jgi:hypothetical protein
MSLSGRYDVGRKATHLDGKGVAVTEASLHRLLDMVPGNDCAP